MGLALCSTSLVGAILTLERTGQDEVAQRIVGLSFERLPTKSFGFLQGLVVRLRVTREVIGQKNLEVGVARLELQRLPQGWNRAGRLAGRGEV